MKNETNQEALSLEGHEAVLSGSALDGVAVSDSRSIAAKEAASEARFAVAGKWSWKRIAGVSLLVVAMAAGGLAGLYNANAQEQGGQAAGVRPQALLFADINKQLATVAPQSDRVLTVNGQVVVGDSLVIVPAERPAKPVAGQVFFDKATNTLTFFNGNDYVSLLGGNVVNTQVTNAPVTNTFITNAPVTNTTNVTNATTVTNVTNITNVTGGGLAGSGTVGAIAVFTGANQLGDSLINQNGGNLNLATAAAAGTTGDIVVATGDSSTGASGNITIDSGTNVIGGAVVGTKTFEAGTDNMVNWFGTAVAQSAAQAHQGSNSLAVTFSSNFWGVIEDQNGPGTPVVPGHQYHFSVWVRANTTGRNIGAHIDWSGASGAVTFPVVADNNAGWTQLSVTAPAPAGATKAYFRFQGNTGAAGEIHYFDDFVVTDLSSATAFSTLEIGKTNAKQITIGNLNMIGATSIYGGSGINLAAGAATLNATAGAVILSGNSSSSFVTTAGTLSLGGFAGVNLQAGGTTVASLSGTGAALFKNSADSTTAFQVQPAAGTTPVFNVDTVNGRIGVGTAAPRGTLDLRADGSSLVIGDISLGGEIQFGAALTANSIGFNDNGFNLRTSQGEGFQFYTDTANDLATPEVTIDINGQSFFNNNLHVRDAEAATKSLRLRHNGGDLDIDGAGDALHFSTYQNADFTGVQYKHLVMEHNAAISNAIGEWNFKSADELTVRHTINGNYGGGVYINQNGEATDFAVQGDTNANLLFVQGSTDRIGMGTGTPAAELHISRTGDATLLIEADTDNNIGGESENAVLILSQDGGFNTARFGMNSTAGANYSDSRDNATYIGTFSDEALQFVTESHASMTILDGAGNFNVGIGNNNPGARLHVSTSIAGNALLKITDESGAGMDLMTILDEGATTFRNRTDSTAAFQIQNAAGTPVMNIDTISSALDLRALDATTSVFNLLHSDGSTALEFRTGDVGDGNIFIGKNAGQNVTTGTQNTALGTNALSSVTTGEWNVAIGVDALNSNTTGYHNVAIGEDALGSNVDGYDNVVVGAHALEANVSGRWNTAMGQSALANSTVDGNTAVGAWALEFNTTGTQNVAVGLGALNDNTTGERNTAVGAGSLADNTIGRWNSAFGTDALMSNTTGDDNTAVGEVALRSNQDGNRNVAVGMGALYDNVSGSYNVALGADALTNNTADSNTAVGTWALESNVTGQDNVGLGLASLNANVTGSYNTALGNGSLFLSTGDGNVGVGSATLSNITTGSWNTGLGIDAGKIDNDGFVTLGTISSATVIGVQAQAQADNSLILGAAGNQAVKVGIGTTIPLNTFSVMPTYYSTGTASQSGNTVTGVGTAFDSTMLNRQFIFASGATGTVTAVNSATSLTLSTSQTVAGMNYRIHHYGLQVTEDGRVGVGTAAPAYGFDVRGDANIQSAVDSTAAFQVQNAAGTSNTFVADTQNNRIGLGTDTPGYDLHISRSGDAIIMIEADTDDVTEGDNATLILSQDGGQFTARFGMNGVPGANYTDSLQNATYLGTMDSHELQLITDSRARMTILPGTGLGNVGIGTTTPGARLHVSSGAAGNTLFRVTDATATAADVMNIADEGAVTFLNRTDSTGAFQIQDTATTALFLADTQNKTIRIAGTNTAFTTLELANAHFKLTQTTAPTIGTPANCGSSPAAAVTAGSTDNAGTFTITTGTGGTSSTCDVTITFQRPFGAAPKSIIVAGKGDAASVQRQIFVSGESATTFTTVFAGSAGGANSTTYSFSYWVVE